MGIPHPARALRRAAHRARRFAELSRIAAQHGLTSGAASRQGPDAPGSARIGGGVTALQVVGYAGLFGSVILLARVVFEIGPFRRR